MVFRGIPEQLMFVGEYCLASLVYHIPFLRTHLPSCHPLYETALFQDTELLVKLSDRVCCGFSDSTSILKATGVPPHVSILGKMEAVQDMTMSTIEKLDDVRRGIVKDIVRELEERAIVAKTVTFEGLHDALQSCLREAGIQNINLITESKLTQPEKQQHYPPSSGPDAFVGFHLILLFGSALLLIFGSCGAADTLKKHSPFALT
ncbi:hypothetical protein PHMEG_00016286 [Phytophthora megakarya]|uniref:Uncharacterized protein n=1 Tax=Phytophthora megakarya TaxID=4795 RepID=A0A225W0R8_9STRA|nr:hypothetical protein PHMEG_00016286 [Phytophthora megakarya]